MNQTIIIPVKSKEDFMTELILHRREKRFIIKIMAYILTYGVIPLTKYEALEFLTCREVKEILFNRITQFENIYDIEEIINLYEEYYVSKVPQVIHEHCFKYSEYTPIFKFPSLAI